MNVCSDRAGELNSNKWLHWSVDPLAISGAAKIGIALSAAKYGR